MAQVKASKSKVPSRDRTYKLKNGSTPLTYAIASFDNPPVRRLLELESQRALRYAINYQTPYVDEQDEDRVALEPIVFTDGLLYVGRHNVSLQMFLHTTPDNGRVFVEIDKEADAQEQVDAILAESDAMDIAKNMSLESLEGIARVVLAGNVNQMKSSEIKRDVLLYAKHNPVSFMAVVDDPQLKLKTTVARFFEEGLLSLRNHEKDVYFNLPNNKKRMLVIPFGEDKVYIVASYLQSDEGVETLKILEKQLG